MLSPSCVLHILCCLFVNGLVYPVLPVSLDCPCFISPSVFSNVYLTVGHVYFLYAVSLSLAYSDISEAYGFIHKSINLYTSYKEPDN